MKLDWLKCMEQMVSILKPKYNLSYFEGFKPLIEICTYIKRGKVLWPKSLGSWTPWAGWVIGFLGITTPWKLKGCAMCIPTEQGTGLPAPRKIASISFHSKSWGNGLAIKPWNQSHRLRTCHGMSLSKSSLTVKLYIFLIKTSRMKLTYVLWFGISLQAYIKLWV